MINYYAKKVRQKLERHSYLIAGLMLIAAGSGIAIVLVRELPATHDACAFTSQGECDTSQCCTWCGKNCTNVASANASCTKSPTSCELSRDEAQCTASSMCQWHQNPAHILESLLFRNFMSNILGTDIPEIVTGPASPAPAHAQVAR